MPAIQTPSKENEKPILTAAEEEALEEKRLTLIKEFIQKEKEYITILNLIIAVFLKPLQKWSLLTKADEDYIFSIIPHLLTLHTSLLELIEQKHEENKRICIGEIFLKKIEYFTKYATYIINQSAAFSCLEKCQQNKAVQGILEDGKAASNGSNLFALLVIPTQRFEAIHAFLLNIEKITIDSHEDKPHLKKAIHRIEKVAVFITRKKEQDVHDKQLLEIEKSIENEKDLNLIGKQIYLKADLKVISKKSRLKDRRLIVLNDMILICFMKTKQTCDLKKRFWMKNLKLIVIGELDNFKNVFQLEDNETHKKVSLTSETSEECNKWTKEIRHRVKEYQLLKLSSNKQLIEEKSLNSS